jgi:gliding motility-associated-like protein
MRNRTLNTCFYARMAVFKSFILFLLVFGNIPLRAQTQQELIINGSLRFCEGGSTTLSVVDTFATYSWSNGGVGAAISIRTGGIYSLTVTDRQNNILTANRTVVVNPLPIPIIGGVPFTCGRPTTLFLDEDYNFIQWSSGETSRQIAVANSGTYSVTVVDANFCRGSSSIDVRSGFGTQAPLPDSLKICAGDSVTLDATALGAISYFWSTQDTTARLVVRDSGRYDVIVSNGQCVSYDTVFVLTLPPPQVNLGPDTMICRGDTLFLRAAPFEKYTYRWNDGSTKPNFKIFDTGIAGVEVSFGNCRASDSIYLDIFDKQGGRLVDTVACTPEFRLVSNLLGVRTYSWTSNGSTSSSLLVAKDGIYQLVAGNGKCYTEQTFKVGFRQFPSLELGRDTTLCTDQNGAALFLKANLKSPLDRISWSTGAAENGILIEKSGQYVCKVSNACGEVSDSIAVLVRACNQVFVPNAFTPNGDNNNDQFTVYPSVEITRIRQFSVFDRWGNLVHSVQNIAVSERTATGWNGMYKGKLLTPSVFIYLLEAEREDGTPFIQKGDITLLR